MVDYLYGTLERHYEAVDCLNGMPDCPFGGVEAHFRLHERTNGTVYRFLRWEMG